MKNNMKGIDSMKYSMQGSCDYKTAAEKIRKIIRKHLEKIHELHDGKPLLTIHGCVHVMNKLQETFGIDDPSKIEFYYDILNRSVIIRLPAFGDKFTIYFDKV